MAISNPCFELWLVLHIRKSPGPQDRHHVQKMLGRFLPGYDKHLDFVALVDLADAEIAIAPMTRIPPCVTRATEHALRLDMDAEAMDEAGRNPTTGVYRLTQSIASERGPDSGDLQ